MSKKQIFAKDSRKGGRRQGGFSLIEILISVAIILIIAAIALPNLLASKRAAATTAAVGNMKTIMAANAGWVARYHAGFSPSLTLLGGTTVTSGVPPCTTGANLLPTNLAADPATVGGYVFTYTPGVADASDTTCGSVVSFTLTASPQVAGRTGDSAFFMDESGTIREDTTGAGATVTSPILQ
jgi:prepilin-type N-terminal cleavage/methylation domain-containing protein